MSSSHYYRQAAAMKRGQFRLDNMAPPEDGPTECAECDGLGRNSATGEKCEFCAGFGEVDEDGFPFDRDQAERDAEENARDEYAYQRRYDE